MRIPLYFLKKTGEMKDDNKIDPEIKAKGAKTWMPVIVLTFAAFVFNTSEFVPIGLLSDIANDFGITEANAGMLITVYAWVVAIASLPLMLVFAKTENKKLLMSITALFIASHIFSGLSGDFYMLMTSRLGVACAHAVFWSMVTPFAVRIAPEGKQAAALGLVVCGSSVAMIVGLPLGRTIGLLLGWRATFLVIGGFAAMILCMMALVLPKTPSDSSISLRKLPALIKSPALRNIYLVTVIAITGHFTCYSYIEPFLSRISGMNENFITMILAIFGIVGLICSFIFSKYYSKHPARYIIYAVCGIGVFLLLLYPAALNPFTVTALCILWGTAINFYNLAFQSEIIRCAPQGTAIAMSIYSGIYNIGIGAGALAGGAVCSSLSISSIGFVGGGIAMAAAVICMKYLLPVLYGKN